MCHSPSGDPVLVRIRNSSRSDFCSFFTVRKRDGVSCLPATRKSVLFQKIFSEYLEAFRSGRLTIFIRPSSIGTKKADKLVGTPDESYCRAKLSLSSLFFRNIHRYCDHIRLACQIAVVAW